MKNFSLGVLTFLRGKWKENVEKTKIGVKMGGDPRVQIHEIFYLINVDRETLEVCSKQTNKMFMRR